MTETLLAAVTPAGPYPPYINVTDMGDGTVRVTLRGNARNDTLGYTVRATFDTAVWEDFARQVTHGPDHEASGTYRKIIR